MERKILYKCEPEKNTECSKEGCKSNVNSAYPACELTYNKDYSSDGIPMEMIRTDRGFKLREIQC